MSQLDNLSIIHIPARFSRTGVPVAIDDDSPDGCFYGVGHPRVVQKPGLAEIGHTRVEPGGQIVYVIHGTRIRQLERLRTRRATRVEVVPYLVAVAPRLGQDEDAIQGTGQRERVSYRRPSKLVLPQVPIDGRPVRVPIRSNLLAPGRLPAEVNLRSLVGDHEVLSILEVLPRVAPPDPSLTHPLAFAERVRAGVAVLVREVDAERLAVLGVRQVVPLDKVGVAIAEEPVG